MRSGHWSCLIIKLPPRSCIVDALSTMVVNDTQLQLYLWYDNKWGYANRTVELVRMVAEQEQDLR